MAVLVLQRRFTLHEQATFGVGAFGVLVALLGLGKPAARVGGRPSPLGEQCAQQAGPPGRIGQIEIELAPVEVAAHDT